MPEVRKTDEFNAWLEELRDARARAKVLKRVTNMELGNSGNVEAVGEGVSESKIDYGPGYRIYFINRGKELIVLLAGGDKSTQRQDIENAKALAKEL